MKILMVCFAIAASTQVAHAYENRCDQFPRFDTRAICEGRSIPHDLARNKSNHRLECTGNVDHYMRYPQTQVKFEDWSNTLHVSRKKAQELKQTLPPIEWSGTIPYQTIERWDYEKCELVTSAAHCGTHEECHDETHTVTDYDSKGNATGSHNVTETVCVQVPNTCYADITYSDSFDCSSETMDFKAHYERPSQAEWNPSVPGYQDALPNKYDLLPGEIEMVQIYSNASQSTQLHPDTKIGDAWNEYKIVHSGSAVGAACRQNARENLDVTVYTVKRDTERASPNAFRLPVDWEGNKVEPLVWASAKHMKTDQMIDKAYPSTLKLDDTSGSMIALIAEQSRKNEEREKLKMEKGLNANSVDQKAAPQALKEKGFWQNTKVRVELVRKRGYWFTDTAWSKLYTQQVESLAPTMHFLSKDEEIKFSDFWTINLAGDVEKKQNLYERKSWWLENNEALKPNRAYTLKVSMYQPGVKFYRQSCADNPDQGWWRCHFLWGIFERENGYYSKPLEVSFRTPKDYDGRNWARRQWTHNWLDDFWTWTFGDEKLPGEKK